MADRHVLLRESTDSMELEYLADLLRQEGIEGFVEGVESPQLVGVAGHVVPLRLMVPEEKLAAAREALAAGEQAADERAPEGPGELPEITPEDSVEGLRDRRNVFLAGGAAFVCPTGGHLYARRRLTALVLALGWLAVLAGLFLLDDRSNLLPVALFFLLAVDSAGGMLAARAHNAGRRRGPGGQLALGLVLLGVAGLGMFSPLAFERLDAWRVNRELDRFTLEATPRAVQVTNRGDFPRSVQVEASLEAPGIVRWSDLVRQAERGRGHPSSDVYPVRLEPGQQSQFPIDRSAAGACSPGADDGAPGILVGLEPSLLDRPAGAPRECRLRVLLISLDPTSMRQLGGKVFYLPYPPGP